MAACEPQVYEEVTRKVLECLSASAKSAFGLALEGDTGSVSAMGTTLNWDYDEAATRLTVTCAAKPIFLSCKDIYGQLGRMLDTCRK
jgi:hypothetical protein